MHTNRLVKAVAIADIALADPPVAKNCKVTDRRSLGDIARLIFVCCLVMMGPTICSRNSNSSAVIRSCSPNTFSSVIYQRCKQGGGEHMACSTRNLFYRYLLYMLIYSYIKNILYYLICPKLIFPHTHTHTHSNIVAKFYKNQDLIYILQAS